MACYEGHLKIAIQLLEIKPDIDISIENDYAFRMACQEGHIKVAKWLFKINPYINISIENDYAFRMSCIRGNIKIIKWIYKLNPFIYMDEEYYFNNACKEGYTELAEWLLEVKPNIDITENNNSIFRFICNKGDINMARLFVKIKPEKYEIKINSFNELIDYRIFLVITKTIKRHEIKKNIDMCDICIENISNVYTSCDHLFCKNCIITWIEKNITCPYCRCEINESNLKNIV